MNDKDYSKSIFYVLLFLSFIVGATIIKLSAAVLIPVTIAVLLSLVVYPLIKTLKEKFHIPWGVGIAILLIAALIVISILFNLLSQSLKTIVNAAPKYEARFTQIYERFTQLLKINSNQSTSDIQSLFDSLNFGSSIQNLAISLSGNIISFTKSFLLIILFTVFLLIELQYINAKTEKALKDETRDRVTNIFRKIINDVSGYISIKFIISLLTGVIVALGCAAIRVDFAIVWGFIAFLANFIPTFGSIISSAATIMFALLQFYPSWGQVIVTAILMIGTNMVLGNIVEPRWEGNGLDLSPFVILVSLSLWGWMWKFTGMILAVPLTVIIKIVCDNVEFLKPAAIMLGNYRQKENKSAEEQPPAAEEKTNQ